MVIFVPCLTCGTHGRVPEKFAGRNVRCPRCRNALLVPLTRRVLPALPFYRRGDQTERLLAIRCLRQMRTSVRTGGSRPLPAKPSERRVHPRRLCPGVRVTAFVTGQTYPTTTYDLSRTGVGVVLAQRLEPGTLVRIVLANRAGEFVHVKQLRVTHATPREGCGWMVGGVFGQQLTLAEFSNLIL